MSQGQRIPIDERATEMFDYFEDNSDISYSDFSDQFGDYVSYLAVSEGPSSRIYEDEERIRVTEADLAIASHFGEAVEEAQNIDWINILKGSSGAAATLGLGGEFLSSGDPSWLTPGLITGYLSKKPLEDLYKDVKKSREAKQQRESSLQEFEQDYPNIGGYEVFMEDLDELDIPVSAVRPGDMDESMQDIVNADGSRGFQ